VGASILLCSFLVLNISHFQLSGIANFIQAILSHKMYKILSVCVDKSSI
jgi:hypothetical protein